MKSNESDKPFTEPFERLLRNMRNLRRSFIGYSLSVYYRSPMGVQSFVRRAYRVFHLHRLLSRNQIIQETVNGVRYELDLREMIDGSIYHSGGWEPTMTKIASSLVRQGMVVFDIGANIGYFTLLFARLVGDSGRVFAFEPTAYAYRKLNRNIELNGYRNIVAENRGISNIEGVLPVSIASSYRLDHATQQAWAEHVTFTTLDQYARTHDISKLDFVKIDTDGFEHKVVEGGSNTLRKFKPIIAAEFGKYTLAKHGDDLSSLCTLLQEIGYEFYSEKELVRYQSIAQLLASVPENLAMNVVCIARKV